MARSTSNSQLERMGSELKCPICLSLYKQAATLSCNHSFCTSCILQSMTRTASCPICKVPTTRREVRCAPQMDSLVAIFKGMETSAGVNLFPTQPSQTNISENVPESGERHFRRATKDFKHKIRGGRKKPQVSNDATRSENMISGPPNKRPRGKTHLVLSNVTNRPVETEAGLVPVADKTVAEEVERSLHGVVPVKKRIQVPRPRDLAPNNQDEFQTSETCLESSNIHEPISSLKIDPTLAGATDNTPAIGGDPRVETMARVDSGVLSFQALPASKTVCPSNPQHRCSPIEPLNLHIFGDQPQLTPFFWLRDPSQEERLTQTQVTQTQGTARALRPSFSDLKDSDDERSEDAFEQEETAGIRRAGADSYDSDTFVWTQRPCSPELSSSPCKNDKQFDSKGLDDEFLNDDSRSPPKRVESPLAAVATQTPQLRQEPARMTRGTLSKCPRVEKRENESSNKACRSLDSPPSEVRRRGPVASVAMTPTFEPCNKVAKNQGNLHSTNSSREIHFETGVVTRCNYVLKDGRIGKNSEVLSQGGCTHQYDLPDVHKMEISKGEKRVGDSVSLEDECRNEDDVQGLEQMDIEGGQYTTLDQDSANLVVKAPACVFCGSTDDSEVAGRMMLYQDTFSSQRIKDVHVHKLCAEWAPDVYFDGDEPQNLACEVTRGLRLKCSNCGKRGAALGCCNKRCKKSFHYPCARATPGCKWDEDDFVIFCPQHADGKFPRRKRSRKMSSKASIIASTTKVALRKWAPGPACKWVICGSGLDCQLKEQMSSFALLTGASVVKRWSPSVTHVITSTDQQGAARRTLKVLLAILEGKWIVKVEWMLDCMSSGQVVTEEQYEVNMDINGFVNGPRRGRALVAVKAPRLLEGLSFYFCGDFSSVGKESLLLLVVAGRGVVLQRKPLPCEGSSSKSLSEVPISGQTIVLYNGEDDGKGSALEDAKSIAVPAGAFVVPHSWLLDSVAACVLQPITT